LNLIEALKSGKEFRLNAPEATFDWFSKFENGFVYQKGEDQFNYSYRIVVTQERLLSDEWEIKENRASITKRHLISALKKSFGNSETEFYREVLHVMTKELGLDD
jgi:hypothetical protein